MDFLALLEKNSALKNENQEMQATITKFSHNIELLEEEKRQLQLQIENDNAGKVTASRSTAPSQVISKKANLSSQQGKDHRILDIETKIPKFTTLDNFHSNLDNKNINTTGDDDIENNNDKNVSKLSERDKDVGASTSAAGAKKTYDFLELINLRNVPLSKIQPKINHRTNYALVPSPRHKHTRHINCYKTYKISGTNPIACRSYSQSFNISGKTLKSNSSGRLSFKPNKPDIIHVLRENVQLNETEIAWKPAHLKMESTSLHEIKIEVYRIEELLKGGADVDELIDYLSKSSKSFIYQLTKTLCKHSLQKINENYTLKKEIFQKTCVPLLQRCIDSNEEFGLECLKAIQGFVGDLEYPTELLFTIFWELLDSNLIPRETFLKWWSTCQKTRNTNDIERFFNLLTSESSNEIDSIESPLFAKM